jgi:alkaline phosphatase D
MRFVAFLFTLVLSSGVLAETNDDRLRSLHTVKRIALGSCNNQNDSQPLWKDMIEQQPDLFIWGGDNVYADWSKSDSVLRAYNKQNAHPDYAEFKSRTPMIGTWDDHDYGFNDAGGGLAFKKESQKLHLDFLDVPVNSPRRSQEGIYTSYEFGHGSQKIKFIILDNRYFKGMESSAPMLGTTQWEWLENEFKNSKASLHFIITGLSIFSPLLPYTEEWWEQPVEVNRMLGLLKTYKVKAPVFLTGDKHFSSIFKYSGQLEFMSSGMTHTAPRRTWWYLGRKYPNTYFGISYGVIDIEWEEDIPKLTLFMRNGERDIHKRKVIWNKNTWNYQ